MGGEEFSVLLPQSDLQRAQRIAERIRAAVAAAPFRVRGIDIPITISAGVSGLSGREPPHTDSVDLLLRQADECLYRSKRAGRNRVTVVSSKKSQ